MKLEIQTYLIVLVSVVLIIASIIPFRWFVLNEISLAQGVELNETAKRAIRKLKRNVDSFTTIDNTLSHDPLLSKTYYDKKIVYHNEFDRKGVQNIDNVLQSLYLKDAFFELEVLSLQHKIPQEKSTKPKINFLIEGQKRLEKE